MRPTSPRELHHERPAPAPRGRSRAKDDGQHEEHKEGDDRDRLRIEWDALRHGGELLRHGSILDSLLDPLPSAAEESATFACAGEAVPGHTRPEPASLTQGPPSPGRRCMTLVIRSRWRDAIHRNRDSSTDGDWFGSGHAEKAGCPDGTAIDCDDALANLSDPDGNNVCSRTTTVPS